MLDASVLRSLLERDQRCQHCRRRWLTRPASIYSLRLPRVIEITSAAWLNDSLYPLAIISVAVCSEIASAETAPGSPSKTP